MYLQRYSQVFGQGAEVQFHCSVAEREWSIHDQGKEHGLIPESNSHDVNY